MLSPEKLEALRSAALTGRNRVQTARRLAGVTQLELAGALGITQKHVSRIEAGAYSDLPLETSRAFADFFGCSIEDLFPVREPARAAS